MRNPWRSARIVPASLLAGLSLASVLATVTAQAAPTPEEEEKARLEALQNDWAGLRRYHADDERLRALPEDPQRVVLLGDSITDAWPDAGPLWDPHFVNRGISGQTTPQMLVRLRPDVIDIGARTLVLLAGTNDIAGNTGAESDGQIEGNIASITELARAHGIRVVLCAMLPAKQYWWNKSLRPAARIIAINAWIRDYAARNGLTFVDYHTPMTDPEGGLLRAFGDDGVHPNAAGYAVMKEALARALSAR